MKRPPNRAAFFTEFNELSISTILSYNYDLSLVLIGIAYTQYVCHCRQFAYLKIKVCGSGNDTVLLLYNQFTCHRIKGDFKNLVASSTDLNIRNIYGRVWINV